LITALFLAVLAPQVQLAAQEHHHYKLIDTGTFGGPSSWVNVFNPNFPPVLNERGTVAGFADTSMPDPFLPNFCFTDCYVSQTFQAGSQGPLKDIGSLLRGASSAALWISGNGLIAGVSENGETDPLYSGFPELRAVLWRQGNITDLGTLPGGGYESVANAVNSSGQVVGAALNTVPDANSMALGNFWFFNVAYGYQSRAFLWDKQNGMQDLGTLGGTDAEALMVNDQRQIVGESYINSTPSTFCANNFGFALTTGAFIWENGEMTNLGTFGGTCTLATYLNNQGEVVGISTLAGDPFARAFLWEHGSLHKLPNAFGPDRTSALGINEAGDIVGWATMPNQINHATLWKNGMMTDLGTLEGDQCSYGWVLNERKQVVGVSATSCLSPNHVFLWENGSIVDLNTLIPPDSPVYLTTPETINDSGEIAGTGADSKGNTHAFLLIPCDENHPGIEGCDYSLVDANTTAATRVPAPAPRTTTNRRRGAANSMLRPLGRWFPHE
jgi:probable HAF family extracellular repeat protein